ncbi:MAG: glycosyltransferase family 4 protein [Candidatus Krumholzibacteriia bacterium]
MPKNASRRVLFFSPYPRGEAASQRFRYEQYFPLLERERIEFDDSPFWDRKSWSVLYERGNRLSKLAGLVRGFLRRLRALAILRRYDAVFVHREMAPVGPPVFEWLVMRLFRKRSVYDFDDAIWMRRASRANPVADRLRWHSKVGQVCRWSGRVSCGNEFLADFARRHNPDVVVNPTVVDTENYHCLVSEDSGARVIGWTGTHSTIPYLQPLMPVLRALRSEYGFAIRVIADHVPDFDADIIEFVPWSKESEIGDLLVVDIGLMPLPDTEWGRGKCGFKILQYMALGIPPVASNVGVNADIIEHGVDGLLCANLGEWKDNLARLLADGELRRNIKAAARRKVIDRYSVAGNGPAFLATLNGLRTEAR